MSDVLWMYSIKTLFLSTLKIAWEYTMQYIDDRLQNFILETYNFSNQCHPNKFNLKIALKRKKTFNITSICLH